MRAVILAVLCGLALATTPLQAAPVPTKPLPSELGAALSLELVRDGWDAAGTATTGVTNGAIGIGATAFQTKVVLTAAMARDGTIPPRIGAVLRDHGVGDP
jgi:hypothetical protein